MTFRQSGWQTPKGMRRYEWLAKMHRVEAKAATEMATKLRLTNQSRWQAYGCGGGSGGMRLRRRRAPWDVGLAKKA